MTIKRPQLIVATSFFVLISGGLATAQFAAVQITVVPSLGGAPRDGPTR